MGAWITQAGFIGTFTEGVFTSTKVIAAGTSSYKLLAGTLPDGLQISTTGTIYGTPNAVLTTTTSKFVIRASEIYNSAVTQFDRTFSVDIYGPTPPTWDLTGTVITTSTGTLIYIGTLTQTVTTLPYLKLGSDDKSFALNHQYINYQFSTTNVLSPIDTKTTYYIDDNDGELPPNLKLSETGLIYGNINESFDFNQYSYGYPNIAYTATSLIPKLYTFYVTADNSVAKSKQLFGALIVNQDVYKVDNVSLILNTSSFLGIPGPITSDLSSLLSLQYINNDNNLGTVRAENNYIFDVRAYDPNPFEGTITYSLLTGTTILTNLPRDLSLDVNGYIYGYIPYQPAYAKTYNFKINATKSNTYGYQTTATNSYTLTVKGAVESTIKWVTDSNLGSISTGEISELAVKAEQINSTYAIKYQLVSGGLPPGLNLQSDGSIQGTAIYENSGDYTFTVSAQDVYNLSEITREFRLTLVDSDTKYTQIYVKPFLSPEKRNIYSEFINDEFTFDSKYIYRFLDPNFGIQRDLKIILEFGIEQTTLEKYAEALERNFYRRRFYFGSLKKAIAINNTNKPIYEIIYADAVDILTNNNGISVSQSVNFGDNTYYPASIGNMRSRLESIILPDSSVISTNKGFLPTFMKTQQQNTDRQPGYIAVIPICYALPGQGDKIISRIKYTKFDFKQINFEVDRMIINNNLTIPSPQYLFFGKNSINN